MNTKSKILYQHISEMKNYILTQQIKSEVSLIYQTQLQIPVKKILIFRQINYRFRGEVHVINFQIW